MSSLPRAVVEQGKRAEELLAKDQAAREAAHRGNTETAPTQTTPPAKPAISEAPQEPVVQTTPPTSPQPSELEAALEAERQKNKVLQGKYNAEVPRLSASLKAEQDARTKLEERLTALEKERDSKPLVSEAEVQEFGEPLVNLARKIAQEEARPLKDKVSALEQENASLRARVGETAKVGASLNTQAFFSALDAKHPDWRAVNADPRFLKWLDEVDQLYGRTRQQILDEAQDALDAARVSAFFTTWKEAVQTRAAPTQQALEAQVTPSSSGGNAPPTTPADPKKKIWSAGEISQFYDRVRRNLIEPAEAGRIELEIQAAVREGRYRPSR